MSENPSEPAVSQVEEKSTASKSDPGSRLIVLMFTDIVGSSALKVELGDAEYVEHVAKPHNRIFREIRSRFPGAVENNYTGDGFLATFEVSVQGAEMSGACDGVTCWAGAMGRGGFRWPPHSSR
jgi:class 3 adenylate cyclase